MYIIWAILAFGLLVIVHEFGHFIMAKANGIKVEEFSIGMGPKLFGIQGKETEYLIKLLPIGGYVKMLGDEEKSDDKRAFNNKSPIRKLSVVVAGPIMNLILSVVLFAIIASFRGYLSPVVSKVVPNNPAAIAGIQAGDEIIKLNNDRMDTWEEFTSSLYKTKGEPVNVTYKRDNTEKTVKITPIKDPKENRSIIGVYPTVVEKSTIGQSLKYGVLETKSLIKQTFGFFGMLFKGQVTRNDVGGPVSIIKISGKAAKAGIFSLMTLSALISAQLAIFNIIPFPALDGGHIVLFLFEMITGRKLDDNKVGVINYIGFAILMAIMVLVTIKDLLYPINI